MKSSLSNRLGSGLTTFRVRAALSALALVCALAAPLRVDALTSTGSMNVTTNVAPACSITATAIDFGSWSFVVASAGTSTITVDCTVGAAVASIALDSGLQAVATIRQLKAAGAATIAYGLYQDAGYATVWNGTGPAVTVYTAVAAPAVFTAYARAPAGPKVPVGTYTDFVTITVTYS